MIDHLPTDMRRGLETYGARAGLPAAMRRACTWNWARRHDPLYRGLIRRDLAALQWIKETTR